VKFVGIFVVLINTKCFTPFVLACFAVSKAKSEFTLRYSLSSASFIWWTRASRWRSESQPLKLISSGFFSEDQYPEFGN
jgi:hypothetical protein